MPTNKSYLDRLTEEEKQDLITEYKTCSTERLKEMARQLGYKNRHTFESVMLRRLEVNRDCSPPSAGPETSIPTLSDIEAKVLDIARKNVASVGEISRQIDRSSETVIKTIDSLREKSYNVLLDEDRHEVSIPAEPNKVFAPTEFKYFRKFYKIGIISDTQICSKYQQMTLLHDAYNDLDNRKADFILHPGDLDDGEGMYRGHTNEVIRHGVDEHTRYICDNYPKSKRGTRTYVIGGQHDFCWYKQNGHDILDAITKERKDLIYRGFFSASFKVKGLKIALQHPGGGVAYARSYKLQKYIENMIGHIASIPSAEAPILQLFGHWHIPCHLPCYMGVDAASLPCFQAQTPYLAEKGLMPVVGYAVAEIYLDGQGNLTSTKIDFINMNAQIKEKDF